VINMLSFPPSFARLMEEASDAKSRIAPNLPFGQANSAGGTEGEPNANSKIAPNPLRGKPSSAKVMEVVSDANSRIAPNPLWGKPSSAGGTEGEPNANSKIAPNPLRGKPSSAKVMEVASDAKSTIAQNPLKTVASYAFLMEPRDVGYKDAPKELVEVLSSASPMEEDTCVNHVDCLEQDGKTTPAATVRNQPLETAKS